MAQQDSPSRSERHAFGLDMLDQIIEWIRSNLTPEQVFNSDQLGEWADANGYAYGREED